MERRGIPAVVIVTDGFIETARSIAQMWGVVSYDFLSMPHPLSSLTPEEINREATVLRPQVLAHVTSSN